MESWAGLKNPQQDPHCQHSSRRIQKLKLLRPIVCGIKDPIAVRPAARPAVNRFDLDEEWPSSSESKSLVRGGGVLFPGVESHAEWLRCAEHSR